MRLWMLCGPGSRPAGCLVGCCLSDGSGRAAPPFFRTYVRFMVGWSGSVSVPVGGFLL